MPVALTHIKKLPASVKSDTLEPFIYLSTPGGGSVLHGHLKVVSIEGSEVVCINGNLQEAFINLQRFRGTKCYHQIPAIIIKWIGKLTAATSGVEQSSYSMEHSNSTKLVAMNTTPHPN